jgi:hypothetical protein
MCPIFVAERLTGDYAGGHPITDNRFTMTDVDGNVVKFKRSG